MEQLNLTAQYYPWFIPFVVFVFGACWGSFLNVCIYRIPKNESVVTPASHCSCGTRIAWYDNLPILSWFILRGTARCCGNRFSIRYPLVELLTACLFLAAWLLLPPAQALPGMFFLAILVGASFIDLDHMILPNIFTVGGMVAGVSLSLLFPGLHGVSGDEPGLILALRSGLYATIGVVVGTGVILWIMELAEAVLRKEAMGYGDVVFMGCIGAFCGWQGALFAIFGGAFIGAIVLFPLIVLQRLRGWLGTEATSKQDPVATSENGDTAEQQGLSFGVAVPFGPWLAIGAAVYFLGGRVWVDQYFEQMKLLFFSLPSDFI